MPTIREQRKEEEKVRKMLDFILSSLKDIQMSNQSIKHLNLGIFYGLVLGIVGNLLVSSIFLYFKDSIIEYSWIIILLCVFLVILLILICIFESIKYAKSNREIDKRIKLVLRDKDDINGGRLKPTVEIINRHLRES